MSCSCIKGSAWNFDIEVVDVKTLRYSDYSEWNETHPYVIPDKHTITVTTPRNTKVELEVNPQGSTIISGTDLGFSACIDDGVYCIEAYSCKSCDSGDWGEKKFTKQLAVLPQSDCKVKNLIATGDESTANKMSSKLKQIEGLSKIGQDQKVADLYTIFNRELEKLNCSSCC